MEIRKKLTSEVVVLLVILASSLFMLRTALTMGEGPSLFPRAVTVFVAILTTYTLAERIIKTDEASKPQTRRATSGMKWWQFVAGYSLYAVALWLVGFIFATFLYMGTMMMLLYRGHRVAPWVYAGITAALLLLSMKYLFVIPIPQGILMP